MVPSQAVGQRVDVYARAGLVGSSALVTDNVSDARIPDSLNIVVDGVRAVPKPGLLLGGGARVAFWPDVKLGMDVAWTGTELQADEGSGTRPIQDLGVLETSLGVSWSVRPAIELGGGAGLVWYLADKEGLFAAGSDTSPVVELRAGWTPAFWKGRLAVVATAQTHRFGTPVIRSAGGQDGRVTRVSVTARIRLLEVGQ